VAKGRDLLTALVRQRLAAVRDAYGLTDAGMARAAHQRQQDVSRFFNGDMKFPPLDFMNALCLVVNLTLADVLRDELPKPELPEWQMRVLATMKAMSPTDRHAFETLMDRGKKPNGTARPRGRRRNRVE
jgi:transcriptional regulator with XRE-family HTH domain